MKIHSKFKDYYDGCQAYGYDPDLHYVREQHNIASIPAVFKQLRVGNIESLIGKQHGTDYRELFYIGFCGRVHIGLGKLNTLPGIPPSVIWDEDVIDCIQDEVRSGVYSKFLYTSRPLKTFISDTRKYLQDDWTDVFIQIDAPVFIYRTENYWRRQDVQLMTNPQLGYYKFASVKDPFTAYQEIAMFIGNQLAKQIDPQPLSDKDRLVAHGMDPTWSFRNPDAPKRKRKK